MGGEGGEVGYEKLSSIKAMLLDTSKVIILTQCLFLLLGEKTLLLGGISRVTSALVHNFTLLHFLCELIFWRARPEKNNEMLTIQNADVNPARFCVPALQ